MKLELRAEGKWHVLKVSGAIDSKALPVVKAGITKLLQTGKNMLAIDLHQATGWDSAFLAPLAPLNQLAQELQGAVVVLASPTFFEAQASPVPHFASISEAMLTAKKGPSPEQLAVLKQEANLKAENSLLRQQLAQLFMDRRTHTGTEALKARILELELELTDLQGQ